MEKTQFETLMLAITGLKTEMLEGFARLRGEIQGVRTELKEEIQGVRTELKEEIQSFRSEVNGRFDRLENKTDVIYKQTGDLTVRVTRLESEGPTA